MDTPICHVCLSNITFDALTVSPKCLPTLEPKSLFSDIYLRLKCVISYPLTKQKCYILYCV